LQVSKAQDNKGGRMYNAKERAVYNQDRERACKRLGISKNQYNWFRREGEKLHRLYEQDCNGELNLNYDNGEYDNFMKPYYRMVEAKALILGLFVYFQTDPRGATIYLDTVKIPENNYTQAVCIY